MDKNMTTGVRAMAGAALLILAGAAPTPAYIEALYSIQQFIGESEVIAEGAIESSDAKKQICVVKVKRSIKGKCEYPQIRINIGVGQEWHAEAAMPHMVVGAPALFFTSGGRAEVYINRFFCQLYADGEPPDKAWWTFTHVEIRCNRTFNGTAQDLIKTVNDVQAGKIKPPPPDPQLPEITRESVKALPVWGKPVDAAKLPPPFIRRTLPRLSKPREPEKTAKLVKGLAYEYFELGEDQERLPDFGQLTPTATGASDQFDLSKRGRDDKFAFRFTGFVDVPKEGTYTFYTSSHDGSKLLVGKDEIVLNDGTHGPLEMSGEIMLKTGKHAIMVIYFQNGDSPVLEVSWEGPNLRKQRIPPESLLRPAK